MGRNREEYPGYIMQKANDYIGHPPEVDEGYEVYMRRNAYAEGYATAVDDMEEKLEEAVATHYCNGHMRGFHSAVSRIKEIIEDFVEDNFRNGDAGITGKMCCDFTDKETMCKTLIGLIENGYQGAS